MSANFYVGQKVVCIDDSDRRMRATTYEGPNPLRKGTIYTVREIAYRHTGGDLTLMLKEIVLPVCWFYGQEYAFLADRFRPLDERKTDISVFTRLLEPSPADRERVEA